MGDRPASIISSFRSLFVLLRFLLPHKLSDTSKVSRETASLCVFALCVTPFLNRLLEQFTVFLKPHRRSARNGVRGFSRLRRPVPAKAGDYFPPPCQPQSFSNRTNGTPFVVNGTPFVAAQLFFCKSSGGQAEGGMDGCMSR